MLGVGRAAGLEVGTVAGLGAGAATDSQQAAVPLPRLSENQSPMIWEAGHTVMVAGGTGGAGTRVRRRGLRGPGSCPACLVTEESPGYLECKNTGADRNTDAGLGALHCNAVRSGTMVAS